MYIDTDQLTHEINYAYGRGVLDGMDSNKDISDCKGITPRRISGSAYKEQFKYGIKDGRHFKSLGA